MTKAHQVEWWRKHCAEKRELYLAQKKARRAHRNEIHKKWLAANPHLAQLYKEKTRANEKKKRAEYALAHPRVKKTEEQKRADQIDRNNRWRRAHRDKYIKSCRRYNKNRSDKLVDGYVQTLLKSKGFERDEMTPELVETTRTLVKLKREIRKCRSTT